MDNKASDKLLYRLELYYLAERFGRMKLFWWSLRYSESLGVLLYRLMRGPLPKVAALHEQAISFSQANGLSGEIFQLCCDTIRCSTKTSLVSEEISGSAISAFESLKPGGGKEWTNLLGKFQEREKAEQHRDRQRVVAEVEEALMNR